MKNKEFIDFINNRPELDHFDKCSFPTCKNRATERCVDCNKVCCVKHQSINYDYCYICLQKRDWKDKQ